MEMNLDLTNIERDGYTFLDWISDIGGIQGILFTTGALSLSFWNYNNLDNFLVTKLYRIRDDEEKEEKSTAMKLKRSGCLDGIRDLICDRLPRICRYCRSSRNDRGLALGR